MRLRALLAVCVLLWAAGICACAQEAATPARVDHLAKERTEMVERQIQARGIREEAILDAMRAVPRHLFVPPELQEQAYADQPLPIGHGQTISQPYIVALMTRLARPSPTDRALEIGTGSGYQAAVLASLIDHVYTIEIVEPLGRQAAERLEALGYDNVSVRIGDGYGGWPEAAPFDIILVTAAPERIPQPLIEQLKPGGRMVAPVGPPHSVQHLRLIEKTQSGRIRTTQIAPVMFVPFQRKQ